MFTAASFFCRFPSKATLPIAAHVLAKKSHDAVRCLCEALFLSHMRGGCNCAPRKRFLSSQAINRDGCPVDRILILSDRQRRSATLSSHCVVWLVPAPRDKKHRAPRLECLCGSTGATLVNNHRCPRKDP